MGLYKTEAIVLRSRKYLEADSLLTLLTRRYGKVGAIAKGVRKTNSRLRGGVQLFTFNEMLIYEGRNLHTVTQSQCLEAFTAIHEDMRIIAAASYWSELLESLIPEGEPDGELFQMALAGFHTLCLEPSSLTIRSLEAKLLDHLGYGPSLEKCVCCAQELGEKPGLSFSVRLGGVLCASCQQGETFHFTQEARNTWQQMLLMDYSKLKRLKISNQGLNILDQVLEKCLQAQVEYPLKSRPILKELLSTEG